MVLCRSLSIKGVMARFFWMRCVVTYERISILPTKEIKKLNFIYGTRIRTKHIWNNFSASPDLELSLAKTKKELRQAPNLKRKRHTILATILGYDFLMTSQNRKNKIVTQNRRKTSFQKPIFQRGFPTIFTYDFISRFSSRHNNILISA